MHYPTVKPIALGIHKEISGINVTKANAISNAAIHGRSALTSFCTGTSPILDITNKTRPKGGERTPIIRFNTMMIPNCTKFTPKAAKSGIRIGVKIVMADVVSINIPTTKRKILTMINSSVLLFTEAVTIPNIV